jgi:uncharacterized protein (TIGR03083 family)
MEYDEHVAAAEREAKAYVAVLREVDGDPRVPTCPEWTLADLTRHVGQFTGFWTHVVCEGAGRSKTPFEEMPAAAGDRAAWYEGLAGHLVEQFRAAEATSPVWTWNADDQTAGFVARRVAHELAIHRLDAQLSIDAGEPVDSALAADGIEEIFMMATISRQAGRGAGETLHLHATDTGHEWFLVLGSDGLTVEREHKKGDLAVRGAVADLELYLYQRPPFGPVELIGDPTVVDAWKRVFTFG